MTLSEQRYSLLFSLLAHLLIIAIASVQFSFWMRDKTFASLAVNMLPAYVVHEAEISPTLPSTTIKNVMQDAMGLKLKTLAKTFMKKNKMLQKKKQIRVYSEASKGDPMPALLALLHAAIQEKQKYPENAIQMGREGSTLLSFTLFPSGKIQALQIVKSSGTTSLDEAALSAVNEAEPFKGVKQFVQAATPYQIAVTFELS